jgi:hypothetical protein
MSPHAKEVCIRITNGVFGLMLIIASALFMRTHHGWMLLSYTLAFMSAPYIRRAFMTDEQTTAFAWNVFDSTPVQLFLWLLSAPALKKEERRRWFNDLWYRHFDDPPPEVD